MLPVKHSVAVMVVRGDEILVIRRPPDDDELPGVWGLPAGTIRGARLSMNSSRESEGTNLECD